MRGRRGPFIAGAVALVVAVLLIVFLVLPKLHDISSAQSSLTAAQTENSTLNSQLNALDQAKQEAVKNKAIIANVQRQIPPTVDLPSIFLLMQNAAVRAGVQLSTMTPTTPVADPTTGLTAVSMTFTATGTYFALTEYLYNLQTLPRVAKVQNVTLSSSTSSSGVSGLSMTGAVTLYTSDTSAGPGSEPGPTNSSTSSTTAPISAPTAPPGT
jgi:Tfp pilus assembly protein PilO